MLNAAENLRCWEMADVCDMPIQQRNLRMPAVYAPGRLVHLHHLGMFTGSGNNRLSRGCVDHEKGSPKFRAEFNPDRA